MASQIERSKKRHAAKAKEQDNVAPYDIQLKPPVDQSSQSLSTIDTQKIADEINSAPSTTQNTVYTPTHENQQSLSTIDTQKIADEVLKKINLAPGTTQNTICPTMHESPQHSADNIQKMFETLLLRNSKQDSACTTTQNIACTTIRIAELEILFKPYTEMVQLYTMFKYVYHLHDMPSKAELLYVKEQQDLELQLLPENNLKALSLPQAKKIKSKIADIKTVIIDLQDTRTQYYSIQNAKAQELQSAIKKIPNAHSDEIKILCDQHECFDSSEIVKITCAALHYDLHKGEGPM